jgi:membrane protease subunit (stomatin/prohibitin family)
MGLFNVFKGQFIDIVEYPDENPNVLVHRFERHNNEIKMGAKLIVRPGQRAVFVNEGRIADAFEPGTYTLTTKNLPVITTLLSLPYNFESPFKAEVYFIRTTEQLDRKWGTPQPVMMRDADFGIVRLRAFGNFAYKVGISKDMISRFVGARDDYYADNLEDQVRVKLISSFSDCLGELKIPALDLAAKYDEISDAMTNKLQAMFNGLGLELLSFAVANISLPEEVQKAMDERSSMGAIGNLNNYSQYQAANALRDAAQNDSGAGNMMGMMVGGQLAGGVGGALHQQQQAPPATPPPVPQQSQFFAVLDGKQAGPFTIDQLKAQISAGTITRETMVWKEGMSGWAVADSQPEIASLFGATPPPVPPPIG